MAAERFRLDHGSWPASLADLKPAYIGEIPSDPFASGPMRLVRKDDSIIVYSVWQDGRDDGGNLDRAMRGDEGTDMGLQLWDAETRKTMLGPR
jgi:hypothetical protein